MPGPLRQSHCRRLHSQHLEHEEEEPAGSTTDALVLRSRPQPSMPSNVEMRKSIQATINKNSWILQLLTEEAHRGWLDGAPDSPLNGPSGTLTEPSPVNPTALGPPAIMTSDTVPIGPAPMIPNAATIPPSPSAHVTAIGRLDTTTPSAPAASYAPDVRMVGDPKPGIPRTTRIAGKWIFAVVNLLYFLAV